MPCSTACAPEALDEAALSRYMALSFAPDPDLFIRTGGEMRISNFLLWQVGLLRVRLHRAACGPTSTSRDRRGACQAYAQRDRRFGGIPTEDLVPQGT